MLSEWYITAMEDAGAPTCTCMTTSHPQARVKHECSTCPDGIAPGERYRRRFYVIDGEPVVEKVCDRCQRGEYEE